MEGRTGAVLKAAAIALVAWLAIDRFLPGLALSVISHDRAALPNALKEPVQGEPVREPFAEMRGRRTFRITPRAAYDVSARVGATERYRSSASGSLLPWDFVLTWGAVTREPAWPSISFTQTGRFYLWSTRDRSLDLGYVSSHTANTHLVPGSSRVASALARVRRGDVVRLEGDLVDIDGPDGFVWKTSLTRTDTGAGACETLYVRAITIGTRKYR
ncbi:MAG: hypothetical protein NEA02_17605 [Thermoanaerobaculia bacterium]|nr:hypothetical protein [Thermoanaerobaculia bacterium]